MPTGDKNCRCELVQGDFNQCWELYCRNQNFPENFQVSKVHIHTNVNHFQSKLIPMYRNEVPNLYLLVFKGAFLTTPF